VGQGRQDAVKYLAALFLLHSQCAVPEDMPAVKVVEIGAPCTTWADKMDAAPWICEVYFERELRIGFNKQ